jgi:hypothetical protein
MPAKAALLAEFKVENRLTRNGRVSASSPLVGSLFSRYLQAKRKWFEKDRKRFELL